MVLLTLETSQWLLFVLEIKTKLLNPNYKSGLIWCPCPHLLHLLNLFSMLPTCFLHSGHAEFWILITIHTCSYHRAFAHALSALLLVNPHLGFRSTLGHHILREGFPGLSDQDKFLHSIQSWLRMPLVWSTVTVKFFYFLVCYSCYSQPPLRLTGSPPRAGLCLLCSPPHHQQLPQCQGHGDGHEMLLNENKVLYSSTTPAYSRVQRRRILL